MTLAPDKRELMRRAFPPKLVGKLPATSKRPALDYVGHAAVTDRLQAVDEDWTFTIDREFEHGAEFWIRGTLTVGGVSRPEYGSGPNPLEAVSHFLRRAAMRFGIALDLWSKEELTSSSPAQVTPVRSSGRDGEDRGGEGEAFGEGAAPEPPPLPPGELTSDTPSVGTKVGGMTTTVSAQPKDHHDHHWVQSPTMRGWQWCDTKGCGAARKKPANLREVVDVPGP